MTMSPARELSDLALLPAIGLEELDRRAALQTRVDRKYLVPSAEVTNLVAAIRGDARVLDIDGRRRFNYASVYFDTPDLISYRLAACRRRRRFKVRTRTYVDSASCWLEVKTRGGRNSTVKQRVPYLLEFCNSVEPGRAFVTETLAAAAIPFGYDRSLLPTLATTYRRTTFFLPGSGSRATLDTDLAWEHVDGGRLELGDLVVVETKTGSTPSLVDRLLWSRGYRPARISKYATGLAALRPDLPTGRWRRTLRTYFTPPAPPVDDDRTPTCNARHCSCTVHG